MNNRMFTRLRNRIYLMVSRPSPILFVGIFCGLFLIWTLVDASASDGKDRALHRSWESHFDKHPQWKFKVVSDMDLNSKVTSEKDGTYWKAYLQDGELIRDTSSGKYSINWGEKEEIRSVMNEKGRSMELSTLVSFNNKLYTCCDRTGIVYELKEKHDSQGTRTLAIPRHILMDGSGDESKGFKCEWSTVKDGELYIGSFGKEWTNDQGKPINNNPQWVKKIDSSGRLEHINWKNNWEALRVKTGTTNPGYMFHESVQWHPIHKRWFFLPRRFSYEAYEPKLDESRGANIILSTSEDFSDVKIIHVKIKTEPERGFSCFRFIPGRPNEILAMKSKEIGNDAWTYAVVVTLDGDVLMEETEFTKEVKYEGVEFIDLPKL